MIRADTAENERNVVNKLATPLPYPTTQPAQRAARARARARAGRPRGGFRAMAEPRAFFEAELGRDAANAACFECGAGKETIPNFLYQV